MDYQIYTSLYPQCFHLNYIDAYKHYLKYNLPSKLNKHDLQQLLIFDWDKYCSNYNLNYKCKIKTYFHYKNNPNNIFFKKNWDLIVKRNNQLFYKYELKLESPNSIIRYNLQNYIPSKHKFALHIHCYNLSNLFKYFREIINLYRNRFDIYVTYIKSDTIIHTNSYITLINISNKGLDIGGKFIFVQYLKDKNLEYDYVLFIHSKSSEEYRNMYLTPITNSLSYILNQIDKGDIGGFFPPFIHMGVKRLYWNDRYKNINNCSWGDNQYYLDLLLRYFNLKYNKYYFPESNFYILHKNVYNKIFGDYHIYNILNTPESFDYNWCQVEYGLNENTPIQVFNFCKENNLDMNYYKNYFGNRDYMIEHAIERIIFLIIYKLNMKIDVLNPDINQKDNLEIINFIINE
jgi:hypothetical protein